jgi:type II secretory pathway pseudopilin PulG
MRIFPKTFLYTLTLLLLIALLANGLVYVLMPKVYVAQKQQELTNQTDLILSKLENLQQDQDVVGLLEDHAGNTQLNLIITVKQNTYSLLSWDGGVKAGRRYFCGIKTGTEVMTTGNASEVMTTVVTACDWLEGNDEREYDGIVTRIIGASILKR